MGSRWKKYVEEGKFRLSVDRRLKIGGRNGDAKLAECEPVADGPYWGIRAAPVLTLWIIVRFPCR